MKRQVFRRIGLWVLAGHFMMFLAMLIAMWLRRHDHMKEHAAWTRRRRTTRPVPVEPLAHEASRS